MASMTCSFFDMDKYMITQKTAKSPAKIFDENYKIL